MGRINGTTKYTQKYQHAKNYFDFGHYRFTDLKVVAQSFKAKGLWLEILSYLPAAYIVVLLTYINLLNGSFSSNCGHLIRVTGRMDEQQMVRINYGYNYTRKKL